MCIMPKPKMPPAPAAPAAPPEAAKPTDPAVKDAYDKEKQRAVAASGRASTNLTGSGLDATDANTTKRQILG